MKLRHLAFGAIGLAVLLVAIAGAAFFLFQRQIGEAMFHQAALENVGRDRSAELPDGLHIFVCGAGSPMPDPSRAGPCIGVLAGQRAFLFDAGSGGPRRLQRMGFPVGRLERVYLTHLHSDHMDSLGELMLQAWVGGARKTPLPIAGPEGVVEVVGGFNAAYRLDSTYRAAHHGPTVADTAGYGGAPEVIPTPAGPGKSAVIVSEGDLKITVIAVDHSPVSPAFGFRVDYKDRSVLISGDTVYSADLVAAAKGVDVMLHEALNPKLVLEMRDAATANGQPHLAKVMGDILDYHASPEDAARAATEAGAKQLVLYHIVPPLPFSLLDAAFLGDAPKAFSGPIRVAEDGLLIKLPAGGTAIEQTLIR